MSEINTQLVREFFELNRFRVLTHWQHDDEQRRGAENGLLLFVERVGDDAEGSDDAVIPFLLERHSLPQVRRAVVEVRAWHADRFYPSVVESSPILGHVATAEVSDLARAVFQDSSFTSVLIISALPSSPSQRQRAAELLQQLGVGHVIEFGTMLADMLELVSAGSNYAPSHTLQTLRLLKRYDLVRHQQLEFRFPRDPIGPETPEVETTDEPVD
jgi:hypothetical protein